jgi:PhnB protein
MSSVSTYLNFTNQTEEAFEFYKKVFGGEFERGGIMRMGDVPAHEGSTELSDEDKKLVMHVSLPILDGHRIMGSDVPESMGYKIQQGNNIQINLEPDSKEEADRLFKELSEGGSQDQPMQMMFWGDYWGQLTDKFGIVWMVNFSTKKVV